MAVDDKYSNSIVFKSISLFGGVQIISILFTFIRTKIISIILGPEGMGIINIITGTLGIIESFLVGGIQTSAVRQIAVELDNKHLIKLDEIIIVIKRIMFSAALFGIVLAIISSFILPMKFLDGGEGKIFISSIFAIFFNIMNARNIIFLQGMRKLKYLAMSTIISGFVSTVLIGIVYFYLESAALIPGIYISSIVPLLVSSIYTRKLIRVEGRVDFVSTLKGASTIVKLGLSVTFASISTQLVGYLTRIVVLSYGDLACLGLFSAGFAIIGSYVGLFFTALGTDYLPRLTSSRGSITGMNITVSKQIEIGLLILTPMLILFIFFNASLIEMLYSKDFARISGMLIWSTIGIIFKLSSWAISFIFIAKGMQRIFILNELVAGLYFVLLNWIGFLLMGLDGLGVSSTICYLVYFIHVYFVAVKKCNLVLPMSLINSLCFHLILIVSAVVIELFLEGDHLVTFKIITTLSSFVFVTIKFYHMGILKLSK